MRVTIDPSTNLIERYSLEVSAGPVSLFDLSVELVDYNLGATPADFRFERHVPDGATIRQVEETDGIRIGSLRISTSKEEEPDEEIDELGYVGVPGDG